MSNSATMEEKAPVNDFVRTVAMLVRNITASITGNGVILLLLQLRCHCNPDHDKFSSLSNTTVVAIFPDVYLWRRILCSNLAGIVLKYSIESLSYASMAYVVASYGPHFISTVL